MEKLAQKYIDFQNALGGANDSLKGTIDALFSPHFKMIVNGHTVVSSKSNLAPQLQKMMTHFGKRKLNIQNIISCADKEQCIVRYFLNVENIGQFDVMAILKSKTGHQIDEVDEIYYKMESI